MFIARKGDTTTLGAEGPVKLKNPPALRPVNPKNPFPQPSGRSPVNPHACRACPKTLFERKQYYAV